MTALRKSDAQLDAEDARKRVEGAEWIPDSASREYGFQPVPSKSSGRVAKRKSVTWLLEAYADESFVRRMTASAPPVVRYVTRSKSGAYDVDEEAEPADGNGENLSAELVMLIGGVIGNHDSERCPDCLANPLKAEDSTRYGPRHPVRRALMDYERLCRRRHRLPTWTDHAAGPVCSMMLRSMVEHGTSLLWASREVGVSYTRAERHVSAAAAYVSRWVEHWDHESRKINVDPDCPVCTRRPVAIGRGTSILAAGI